ncbi:hypothetical protein NP233_g6991 [Leucocoprinus birnbaumii]|uniref:Kinesin-like protein n=1 Tax=Leucocoprinus birnbaumii TaxID=56174 RepID=A0AAD5VSG7_9AGAR|nr:hypothetical protein NP233_g6991 [Leucocoprinus birnbaumii]
MASHRIKIAARLRPSLPGEITDDDIAVHHPSDDSSDSTGGSYISVVNPRDITQIFKFPFTSCYGHDSTQEEIFDTDVEPLLDVVYSGVTVTIFAYGVTSSGKTHTMQGTRTEPGIIPRTVQALFNRQSRYQQYQLSFHMSYMELYKDEPYDLLVTRENVLPLNLLIEYDRSFSYFIQAPKLPVREDGNGMVFVANLSSVPIESVAEFEAIYNQATKNRSIGATNLNRASSRSHAILTIEIMMVDPSEQKTLTGKINLVDLAGSENNKLTGNDPSRMAESKAINQSLSVLGQVVHALNQGAPRIPYRNSKLTRLLQDALGGASVGLLICNLAPGSKFRQDTLNTLNFATRTKNVENKPVINERDNRPVPKPHFAAPPAPKPAATILQPITTAGSSSSSSSTAVAAAGKARASLCPNPNAPRSRVPRVSNVGVGGTVYQRFAIPGGLSGSGRRSLENIDEKSAMGGLGGLGLTEKEIEEKIMKVVEAEVAKRLAAEREKDEEERRARGKEEAERIAREKEERIMAQHSPSKRSTSLPSGVLTPLLKKHKDLDDELRSRLQELERKLEQGHKETSLAGVLSPVSKKKTGRAYVSLARAYSEKGKLEDALELYRRAEAYVPDNIKLKERIIELEWAVKNNKEFVPTPKPPRKEKKGKKGSRKGQPTESDSADPNSELNESGRGTDTDILMDEDAKPIARDYDYHHKFGSSSVTEFGMEITNTTSNGSGMAHGGSVIASGSSPRLCKRLFADVEDNRDQDGDGVQDARTPKKVKLTDLKASDGLDSEDEVEGEVWQGELQSAPLKERKAVVPV